MQAVVQRTLCAASYSIQCDVAEVENHRLRIHSPSAGYIEILHISQVLNEIGLAITEPHSLKGAVVNVFGFPDHKEYYLGGYRGSALIVQAFEQKQAVIVGFEPPEFLAWYWQNEERGRIPQSILKLDVPYNTYDPKSLINSVIKIRSVVNGYPVEATLEEFRPSSVDYRPKPSTNDGNCSKVALVNPIPDKKRPRDPSQGWQEIGGYLGEYIARLTSTAPENGDSKYLRDLLNYMNQIGLPNAEDLGLKLKDSIQKIEQCVDQKSAPDTSPLTSAMQITHPVGYQQPPTSPQHSYEYKQGHSQMQDRSSYEQSQSSKDYMARAQSEYDRNIQTPSHIQIHSSEPNYSQQPSAQLQYSPIQIGAPQTTLCERCNKPSALSSFCKHSMCEDCITNSLFALKCVICRIPLSPSREFEKLSDPYKSICSWCTATKLTIKICSHKACRDCLLRQKQYPNCIKCHAPLDQPYMQKLLSFMNWPVSG